MVTSRGGPDAAAADPTHALDASAPDAGDRSDGGSGAAGGHLAPLQPLRMTGPEKTLAALCGPTCRIVRQLPNVAPFQRIALAVSADPDHERKPKVQLTQVVFQSADGWYGGELFRVGDGMEDVEMINPPDVGMPPYAHMNRHVRFTGAIERVRTLVDASAHATLVAVELTRGDMIDVRAIVLCGAGADAHPACGEVETDLDFHPKYAVDGGVVTLTWKDGTREQMTVFPREE